MYMSYMCIVCMYVYVHIHTYIYISICLRRYTHVFMLLFVLGYLRMYRARRGFWRLVVLLQGVGEGLCIIRAKVFGNLQRGPLLIGKSCVDLTLLRPPCILAKLPHLL